MGFPECSGKNPCAIHDMWGEMRESLRATLTNKNIAQMAKGMKKPEYKSVLG
jgi:DNA-binding IscR family transcriptional regulator